MTEPDPEVGTGGRVDPSDYQIVSQDWDVVFPLPQIEWDKIHDYVHEGDDE